MGSMLKFWKKLLGEVVLLRYAGEHGNFPTESIRREYTFQYVVDVSSGISKHICLDRLFRDLESDLWPLDDDLAPLLGSGYMSLFCSRSFMGVIAPDVHFFPWRTSSAWITFIPASMPHHSYGSPEPQVSKTRGCSMFIVASEIMWRTCHDHSWVLINTGCRRAL